MLPEENKTLLGHMERYMAQKHLSAAKRELNPPPSSRLPPDSLGLKTRTFTVPKDFLTGAYWQTTPASADPFALANPGAPLIPIRDDRQRTDFLTGFSSEHPGIEIPEGASA